LRHVGLASLGFVIGVASCEAVDSPPHGIDQFSVVPTPLSPKNDSLVAGDRKITVYFTPSEAMSFAAICRVGSAEGAYGNTGNATKSPVVVENLTNGTEYACGVWAFNYSKYSPPSNFLNGTPKAP
jgi:hypothetical protein